MQLSAEIALEPLAGKDARPLSGVYVEGRPTGLTLSGRVLEAAVRYARGWLLFVTDDVPFEEVLTIYLLDETGRQLLDSARIGGMYATGTFTDLTLDPPRTASFRFIDDAIWSVHVLDRPRTILPWWSDARGVWRGPRLKRYFEVSRRTRQGTDK